jgi:starch-binding outer membrane protein, SusD/RagB family
MTHSRMRLAAVACFAITLSGCKDFLTGPGLTESPNTPTEATPLQLFAGVQAAQFTQQESQLARLAAMYTQQLSGTNNQQQSWGSQYLITEGDISVRYSLVFTGGGLLDIRRIQDAAQTAGDKQFEGIAKVWEAFSVGMAASLWGDIPYREAVDPDIATPKLDPQQQVYADVQAKLDSAIVLLDGAGPGPGVFDRVYGGNVTRWKAAANTIKARFAMHLFERQGNSVLATARAAALKGISEVPANASDAIHSQGPGDLRAFHGAVVTEGNLWAQFLGNRQDMTANQTLIAMLQRRNDPRLAAFFTTATGGGYRGADQFGRNGAGASLVNSAVRLQFGFRQPFVTWAENQLILAEVAVRLGDADPLPYVNAVRRSVGMPDLTGPITLAQVMEEKYIALFQNIEVWNDYKRSCFPTITPGGANNTAASEVPGRVPYGLAERNTNPNIPAPNAQPTRNWNDPSACPRS